MADKSKIEWTEATWNFLAGCSKVSAGCKNCYAIKDAHRLAENPNAKVSTKYKGTTVNVDGKLNWTGKINLDEEMLKKPLTWTRPRKIFVNSMSDLFHESVPDEWIDKAFAVMALCPQHTFQILTKRPERMRDYFSHFNKRGIHPSHFWGKQAVDLGLAKHSEDFLYRGAFTNALCTTLKNVWLGVSIENQKTADERIPLLLETPAAVRFLSIEPLLGKIDLSKFLMYCAKHKAPENPMDCLAVAHDGTEWRKPNWVIAGGESGANARPVHPDWIRSIRDQCVAANVPFFFKQWGTWGESGGCDDPCGECVIALKDGTITGTDWQAGKAMRGGIQLHPFGKKKTGRILDGRTWDELPK